MNVYQEQARRRIAVRKRIEEIGDADLLELQERADMFEMNECCRLEIEGEWGVECRKLVPADFDFGHGCASCTITRVLMHLVAEKESR